MTQTKEYKEFKNIDGTEVVGYTRKSDGASIPKDDMNRDYQAYLAWVAEGNTAEAAD